MSNHPRERCLRAVEFVTSPLNGCFPIVGGFFSFPLWIITYCKVPALREVRVWCWQIEDAGGVEALTSGREDAAARINVSEKLLVLERLNPTPRPTT
jgi:hypothetical protein